MKHCTKYLATAIIGVSGLVATNLASASQQGSYFGLQYNSATYDDSSLGFSLEFDSPALVGRAGTYVDKNVSIEGRFGIGLSDDTKTASGTNDPILGTYAASIGFEIDTMIGAYALGHIPLSPNASIYGLLGFTKIDATLTGSITTLTTGTLSVSVSAGESDLSYGFGVDIGMNETTSINLEYVSYVDKNEFDINSINVGLTFKY